MWQAIISRQKGKSGHHLNEVVHAELILSAIQVALSPSQQHNLEGPQECMLVVALYRMECLVGKLCSGMLTSLAVWDMRCCWYS